MTSPAKKPVIVAMIPARLGSQRIPKKNLRLLGGRVLTQWVGQACIDAGIFDSIYINSESDVFAPIAAASGLSFYQRPTELAGNGASNDDFALDFINQVRCDVLVQVNPTSPFTSADDIRALVRMFVEGDYKTVHTVKEEQIEGLFQGRPLNFDPEKQMPPSQDLVPVQLFTSSIMAWDTANFCQNMAAHGCAVYGGAQKTGYYVIRGEGMIDIDHEKDFYLAEAILTMKTQPAEKHYYEI